MIKGMQWKLHRCGPDPCDRDFILVQQNGLARRRREHQRHRWHAPYVARVSQGIPGELRDAFVYHRPQQREMTWNGTSIAQGKRWCEKMLLVSHKMPGWGQRWQKHLVEPVVEKKMSSRNDRYETQKHFRKWRYSQGRPALMR